MEFLPATSKQAALDHLARHRGAALILAGGTDLMRRIARDRLEPTVVIHIETARELALIEPLPGKGLRIGALATQRRLADGEGLADGYQALRQAAAVSGSVQTRNVGTIGGNVCTAAPTADLVPALMVHNAVVLVESAERGSRSLSLHDVPGAVGISARQPDELVVGFDLEETPPGTADVYIKVGRRGAMEVAILGLGVRLTMASDGQTVDDIRIAVGAFGPAAFRATEAEAILKGGAVDDRTIDQAASAILRHAEPADDVLASASYRAALLPGVLARAIRHCADAIRYH